MVFYFTATGNSLYVAKCIDEYPVSIPQVIKNSSIYSDNQIGIVCPVYCGEIPNTVKEFLKKSKFETKYMYLILTYTFLICSVVGTFLKFALTASLLL